MCDVAWTRSPLPPRRLWSGFSVLVVPPVHIPGVEDHLGAATYGRRHILGIYSRQYKRMLGYLENTRLSYKIFHTNQNS
jgi:hypothetical protein